MERSLLRRPRGRHYVFISHRSHSTTVTLYLALLLRRKLYRHFKPVLGNVSGEVINGDILITKSGALLLCYFLIISYQSPRPTLISII